MADERHKLQKEPPEGSRKVVDHELARQAGQSGSKPRHEGGESGGAAKVRPATSR